MKSRCISARTNSFLLPIDKENYSIFTKRVHSSNPKTATSYKDRILDKFAIKFESPSQLENHHEKILYIGDRIVEEVNEKRELKIRAEYEQLLENERMKMIREIEERKRLIESEIRKELENEIIKLTEEFNGIMENYRIQRDREESEKIKALIKEKEKEKLAALEKQAKKAELELQRQIEILKHQIRQEIETQYQLQKENDIRIAVEKAKDEFKLLHAEELKKLQYHYEQLMKDKLKSVNQTHDKSIEVLILRASNFEEKWIREKELRAQIESDFRLLQIDYKRFMNYTGHFNSDYMMKLRHVGESLIDDQLFEKILDAKLNALNN